MIIRQPDGTPYNHLSSLENRMTGLKYKLRDLKIDIDNGTFEGDALKAAQGAYNAAQKQYENILNVMESADKAVKKLGKLE